MYNISHQFNTSSKSLITKTPLSDLKEITLKNLVLGKTHVGNFIKLTIQSAFQMAAVQIQAIDSNNKPITLSIYNFPFEGKSYEHFFYKGIVLYVKEPFYKVTVSGILGIRVDDPSDVEFEKNVQKKNNSIQDKKAECRELIKKNKYIEAYSIYDTLLKKKLNDQDEKTILINKAIVCFQLNLKQQYKENIQKALKIYPNNQKAHFHLIKANTISFESATVQKYKKLRQNIQQNKNLSEQSKKDLNEFVSFHEFFQKNQKIDWHKAIKTQNLGEYWNLKIKVDKSPHGRGIIATQTILPGQILIIEKPLAWNRFQRQQTLDQNGEYVRMIMHMKKSDRFVSKIMPLFKLSKQFQKKLFTLSSKHYAGNEVNSKNRPKDRDQIEGIFQTNAFTDYQMTNIFNQRKNYNEDSCYDLIYEKICLINHQCENNCDRFNIGTSEIVYATRQIKPQEQLTIIYKPIWNVKERQQALKHWGILHCRCLMCREQRGDHIDKAQGQSYSKYYFAQSFNKIKEYSWQTISKKIYGLFLVQNIYKQSINNPMGDRILADMFSLNQIQIQDLKNTFK